jgi:hypothetical protein
MVAMLNREFYESDGQEFAEILNRLISVDQSENGHGLP